MPEIPKTLTDKVKILMYKYWEDELTVAEKKELDECCRQDPDIEFIMLHLADKIFVDEYLTNLDNARSRTEKSISLARLRLQARLGFDMQEHKVIRWPRLAAAAVVLLIIVGAAWYVSIHGGKKPKQIIANNRTPILPATHDAALTLSSGQKFILNNTGTETLWNGNGVNITRSGSNINYTVISGMDTLHDNTLETPSDRQYSIILPDGSKAWLNSKSSLRFPATFAGGQRKVELLKGEGYFEIAQNSRQPFHVKVQGKNVNVLGTKFNIKIDSDGMNMQTTVVDGKVSVSDNTNSVILVRDQQLTSEPGKLGQPEENIDVSKVIGWRQSLLKFDDSLTLVLRTLAQHYNKKLELNARLERKSFKGTIDPTKTLGEALTYISHSQSVFKYQITDNKMIISQ